MHASKWDTATVLNPPPPLLPQHHGEGCQSSPAAGQLQSPQHEVPQRQASGQSPSGFDPPGWRTATQFLFTFSLLLPPMWKEVEARSDLAYPHFTQLYRTLMFDAQKSVSFNANNKHCTMFLDNISMNLNIIQLTSEITSTAFYNPNINLRKHGMQSIQQCNQRCMNY